MAAQAPADDNAKAATDHRAISVAFDPDFYTATYTDLPDHLDPLWHYRMAGWRESRDPAPWFSTEDYLRDNPDVAAEGLEPFAHYLQHGRDQGRSVSASRHARRYFRAVRWSPAEWTYPDFDHAPRPAQSQQQRRAQRRRAPSIPLAEQRAAVLAEFDVAYYLAINPDVAGAGLDPLEHFLVTGWLEDRDPSAAFSVRDYLADNPDVAESGINPFVHYIRAGRAEGRAPKSALGFRHDVIARLRSPGERIAETVAAADALRLDPAARLASALGAVRDLHITLSHDDYTRNFGGLQMCLRRESAQFAHLGVDHLHLFPAAPSYAVRADDEPGPLGVLLNGQRLGVHRAETVRDVLADLGRAGRRSFAIHSLLGHAPEATADLLAAAGLTGGYFWLHDFASLCAGFHLLRNDVEDCAAPPSGSAACGICIYGPFRARHTEAHRRLFERLRMTVVAPSRTTLDFWRAHTDLPAHDAVVRPHATLKPRKGAPAAADGPFRLAFLGMPTSLKGWPVFRDLAISLAGDPRYEFLHLGGRPDPAAPAAFHAVLVTGERPLAMQEAVEALQVDAALIWPLCRETFSFTAYEAAAGGAAVITGPDSGNVAAFASDAAVGRVFADEAALVEAFASGRILELARKPRGAKVFDLVYSGMTADLVAESRP
ncbi:hypothetical protein [Phenylobacterium sp.]|uniref:hypothetical protein n=1 Tax=Phenylobacterium sp. TaxID=1871053 RepID=UPI002EDB7C44